MVIGTKNPPNPLFKGELGPLALYILVSRIMQLMGNYVFPLEKGVRGIF